jgi:hypothetical protein
MIYRLFAFSLDRSFVRIDDFTDDVTTLQEAKDLLESYRKGQNAPDGTRFILTQEVASFEVARAEDE